MELAVQPSDLAKMKDRLAELPAGNYEVTSIGAKNYLMWVGGNWEEKYDFAIHDFFANAKRDVSMLIFDYEHLKELYQEQQKELVRKDECIEKLRSELMSFKKNTLDDGR